MNGPYVDLYALCRERSVALARRFLDEWAPSRVLSAADMDADQVLAAMEASPDVEERLYWRTQRLDEVEHVMLFFTEDGAMIAGVSVAAWNRPDLAEVWLERLVRDVGGEYGYAAFEEPPVTDGADAFRDECARRETAIVTRSRGAGR